MLILWTMYGTSLWVRGWIASLSSASDVSVVLPPDDSPDWVLLDAQIRRQSYLATRSVAVVIVVAVCAIWPLDLLLVSRPSLHQQAFTDWRLTIIGLFSAMFLTFATLPLTRRAPVAASAPFCFGACLALGKVLSALGGLERPYFSMASAATFVTIISQGPLLHRLAFTLGLMAALCAGFFGSRPEHLETPLLWEALIHLSTVGLGAVLIGHASYIGFCQRFFQGLVIERTALELKTLNEGLGARVLAKTAELQRLTEHLQVVQDDERGRIARELHDELGQRLSAMRYVIANVTRRFARAPATIGPNLAELDEMVDGALESTRVIVSGLRPPLLEQLGLGAAIEWMALRVTAQAGLGCTLDLDPREVSNRAVSVAAYRVVQESLTNVVRHANARGAVVRLSIEGDGLTVEVTDDGQGFSRGAERARDGNGILGMRERARALGGELTTEDRDEGGARVRLWLPLRPAGEEGAA